MRSSIVIALACLVSLAALPARASDQPDELMPGRIVIIKDGQFFKLVAKPSEGNTFELPDATNDPTVAGGTLEVFDDDPSRPVTAEANLIPSDWKALGNPPGSTGYRFRRPDYPCRLVMVRGTLVKAVCQGGGGFFLPTPFTGQVGIVLTIGTNLKRYCAVFGGEEMKNDATLLKRRNAPAPSACPLDLHSSTTFVTTTTTTSTTEPPGLFCCDFTVSCAGGIGWNECFSYGTTPVASAVCDVSGDCVPPPGAPGGCCDSMTPPYLPNTCGIGDATYCADAGGTYHPASVCEASGFCNP
jgi:hypothetical protein